MKQHLSRFRCQGSLAELSQCLAKAHAFKSWHEQELSWAHSNGSPFTSPLVMGTDFMPPFSSPAERYLVALDQILISSEFPFSVLPALDLVSASLAHHMVLCKHFLKPFCYRTARADVFAGMRLAGLSHIHSFKQEFLITLPIF